jgi:malonyl-CoA O-methyltransferase
MSATPLVPPGRRLSAPVPGLDPVAAARWCRLPRQASPWLHEEVGRRMAERLEWIVQAPSSWVDWSALLGGLQAHRSVAQRYPQAQPWLAGEQTEAALAALAPADRPGAGWAIWRRRQTAPLAPLPWTADGAGVGMVWANMALHLAPDPQAQLAQWRDMLAVDGFLMFSCLGPDTGRELRALYAELGWPAPAAPWVDMHDLGDMLVQAGMAEPVMDMERFTLTYASAERLLRDLRETGRNLSQQRPAGLRGRRHRQALLEALERRLPRTADGQLGLTVEVIYGHAYRPTPRVSLAAATTVTEAEMRQMLRRGSPRA